MNRFLRHYLRQQILRFFDWLLSRVPCYFNLHEWVYTEAYYGPPGSNSEKHNIREHAPLKPELRTCRYCEKTQEKYEHCLGRKPKEWHYFWQTVRNKNGE